MNIIHLIGLNSGRGQKYILKEIIFGAIVLYFVEELQKSMTLNSFINL